jgi:capsular exopolysaccharide synthesis family protein
VGKTYEALKRAEAERRAKAERTAEGEPVTEIATEAPESVESINLPTPAGRTWFRFGKRGRAGNGSARSNGHTNGNGNGYRNGNTNGNGNRNANGNGNGNGHRDPFSFDVPPITVEEFHQLRKNIFATKVPRSLQLMLLVSSRHGEGATTTTALLGSTMAQGGRCLLIDANFRTPGLTRIFGGVDAPGFCEALASNPAGATFYHPTEIPNLYFMPTGRGPARLPYMFEGNAFDQLVGVLRREFDVILIDGAPMEMYADSSYLAPRADGVILVVQAENTPIGAPVISLRELERVGAHILGAVLNKTQSFIPEALARLTYPQEVIEVAVVPGPEAMR